ncbi:hypothetical protein KJ671_00095 [Patescibacteria group bacterium]|nr:hypothetical protein [Patescibacteria group bacterium]
MCGMNESIKNSPKDFFLHLLIIISLYVTAGSIIALLFQYINILFPDPLEYMSYNSISAIIRRTMALLIIVFPVYIMVSKMLQKEYIVMPEKREYRFKKWLTYLTLFFAGSVIITDLVVLVNGFLGGDLTSRFALKILVVLLVAGTIFWYYRKDLNNPLSVGQLRYLACAVSLFILASIVAGFFSAGSPTKARLYNFDERKVGNLNSIQNYVINYWQKKQVLPEKLEDLNDSISGFIVPKDPQTLGSYEYIIKDDLSFELCANFNLPSNFGLPEGSNYKFDIPYGDNWEHEIGRHCFLKTIDPELYSENSNTIPMPIEKIIR